MKLINKYMEKSKTKKSHSGVEMTSLEEMHFSIWLNDKSGILMNTLYPEERKKVVTDWLNEYRKTVLKTTK
jgi:hypothetical protein